MTEMERRINQEQMLIKAKGVQETPVKDVQVKYHDERRHHVEMYKSNQAANLLKFWPYL